MGSIEQHVIMNTGIEPGNLYFYVETKSWVH